MQQEELERCIDLEIVKTEKRRLDIFLSIILFGMVLLFLNILFFPITISEVFVDNRSINFGVVVGLGFVLFLLISRLMVGKISSCDKPLPIGYTIYSLTVESLLPFVWIFYLIKWEQNGIFLDSPLIFIFIPIIIVSALHLSFVVSFINGLVIAIGYGLLSYWTFEHFDNTLQMPSLVYYTKALMFLLSGAIAGLVAMELKKRLTISMKTQGERDTIEALFRQQVSKEVVQALKATNGESFKIEATVLFLDIRNFTNKVQHLSPEEVNKFQNKFFEPLMDCIHKNGGVINQIMGDGLMASFASENGSNYEGAYNSTIDILDRIKKMNKNSDEEINVGIGIHSGDIIAGNIGNKVRQQFSMSGIPVIVAARLEQMTKEYNCACIVSSNFYQNIESLDKHGVSLGMVKMKGIDQEIEIIKLR